MTWRTDPGTLISSGEFLIDQSERKRKLKMERGKLWRHRAGVVWRVVLEPVFVWSMILSPIWMGAIWNGVKTQIKYLDCVSEQLSFGPMTQRRFSYAGDFCSREIGNGWWGAFKGACWGVGFFLSLFLIAWAAEAAWDSWGGAIYRRIQAEWDPPEDK